MGSDCLGPKKRINEVYIEIIDQIFLQVKQTQQLQNLEIIGIIKENLQKKGLLKKLVDNLISHRSKIYDSIRYNYLLVVQDKTELSSLAGILIADSILSTVYKATSQIGGNYYSTQPSAISIDNKQMQILKTTAYPILNETILRQLDIRFQLNYLRMIIFIMQNFKNLYKQTLDSLLQYAVKRTMRITFATQTGIILKKIGICIDKNILKSLSLEVYYHLLRSIKETNNQQFLRDQQRIKSFFKLWLRGREFQEGRTFLFQILGTYIHRSINQSQSKLIQSILINLYDEKKFQQAEIEPLEKVVFEISTHQDFYVRFTKSLLINILSYISYSKDVELLSKEKIALWGISEDYQNDKYKNANDQKSKINALIFVHKLAQKQIIDLNETVTYNRYYFIAAYTFNLFSFRSNKRVCSDISEQFKNILTLLNLKSANIILQTLFQELKLQNEPQYQEHIINLIYNLIDLNNLIEIREGDYQFFPKVSVQYQERINILIIQVGTTIIGYLSKRKAAQILDKLCGFLVDNYEVLTEKQSRIKQKKNLLIKMQNCLKIIHQKGLKSLLQAYLQCINQNLDPKNHHTSIRDFFTMVHIEQTKALITKKQIPQYLSNMLNEIEAKSQNQTIESQKRLEVAIQKLMKDHPLQLNYKIQKPSEETQFYKDTILKYFAANVIEQRRRSSEIITQLHFAERQNSVVRRQNSDLSMDTSIDPGFNQIISVIKR